VRATSLLVVLVAAKTITLLDGAMPVSVWVPFAYFWQDVLVALGFFVLDWGLRRPALAWIAYGAIVAYTAINVPVTRVLSTPLTWTIVRAARGPLADSVTHYVTVTHLGSVAVIAAAGAVLPWLLARRAAMLGRRAIVAAIVIVFVGAYAVSHINTRGLHRNALGALVATSLPRLTSAAGTADWRASPFGGGPHEDLSRLRASARGRNVVLVVLESTAAQYLGLYGADRDPTPALTELASRAIVLDRAYAVYPESIKGLFATLCSRYPAFDTEPEIYADVPCESLAGRLREAGYRTALFHSGRFEYLGMKSIIDNRGFELLEDAGGIGGQVNSSFGVDEPSTVRRVLQWIDGLSAGERFFVMYLPIAGHHPYTTTRPGPFEDGSDLAQYMNAIHEGDEAFGELLRGLRARHMDDKTLIVAFGDHGEAFGQHPGNFAHTLFVYEENIRVPYVIAAPGAATDQIRVRRVASMIDTAPTILDLLGLPIPAQYQGVSMLGPAPRMALFYTDYSLGWLGLVDSCWKYLYEIDLGRSQLFDVCKDPGETHDRTGEFDERVRAYRDRLLNWAAAQKDLVRRGI
jgi:hypothetical protein